MWADVLTKPLQGLKFITMRAFLMNCSIDYSKEPLFAPPPTHQQFSPNIRMKPRLFSKTTSPPSECVSAQTSGTKVPYVSREPVPIPIKPTRNNVSWRDTRLANQTSPAIHSSQTKPLRIQVMAE
jgi:hypothetical protein